MYNNYRTLVEQEHVLWPQMEGLENASSALTLILLVIQ